MISDVEVFIENIQRKDPSTYTEMFAMMEHKLKGATDKSLLIELYQVHSENLINQALYDSAKVIIHQSMDLVEDTSSVEYVQLSISMAMIHYYLDSLDSMDYWYQRSLSSFNKHEILYGSILFLESILLSNKGEYTLEVERLMEAIKHFISHDDKENLASAYYNMALVYHKLGEVKLQEEYLLKAVEILEDLGLAYGLIQNYNALGSLFRRKGDSDKAMYYYNLAFGRLKESDYPLLLAQNYTNRANILEKMGKYTNAETLFLESRKISEENGFDYGLMLCDLNLGNLYRLRKEYTRSAEYLQRALSAAIDLGFRREKSLAYERLSWLERDRLNFEKAFDYQTKFHELNDSLVGESVQKEILDLQQKYETEKKENEILSLSKQSIQMQFAIVVLISLSLILILIAVWIKKSTQLKLKKKYQQEHELRFELKLREKELLSDSIKKLSVTSIKESISADINEIIKDFPKTQASKFKSLLLGLKNDNTDQSAIDEFEARFLGYYDTFYENLKIQAPGITPTELRVAALIRLNFSSKELAMLTNRSIGTIDNVRSSIRKKLNMADDEILLDRLSKM